MLLPRYSLRTTLLGITLCTVVFLIVGYAYRGHAWALVISVAIASLGVTLAFHVGFYLLAAALGHVVGARIAPARTNQGGIQTSTDHQRPPDSGWGDEET